MRRDCAWVQRSLAFDFPKIQRFKFVRCIFGLFYRWLSSPIHPGSDDEARGLDLDLMNLLVKRGNNPVFLQRARKGAEKPQMVQCEQKRTKRRDAKRIPSAAYLRKGSLCNEPRCPKNPPAVPSLQRKRLPSKQAFVPFSRARRNKIVFKGLRATTNGQEPTGDAGPPRLAGRRQVCLSLQMTK